MIIFSLRGANPKNFQFIDPFAHKIQIQVFCSWLIRDLMLLNISFYLTFCWIQKNLIRFTITSGKNSVLIMIWSLPWCWRIGWRWGNSWCDTWNMWLTTNGWPIYVHWLWGCGGRLVWWPRCGGCGGWCSGSSSCSAIENLLMIQIGRPNWYRTKGRTTKYGSGLRSVCTKNSEYRWPEGV